MLWTGLFFPDFCLQALARVDPSEKALAISSRSTRPDLLACNAHAQRLGVEPGMSVAAALALAPQLDIHPRDEQLETQALQGIAAWAGQFTPTLSIAFPHGVLLEVGSCLAYFGGLGNLLEALVGGLRGMGWDVVPASAPTPSGALLLARAGLMVHALTPQRLKKHLGALPLAFLGNARGALETFDKLGLASMEDLLKLPAEAVARRFGQPLLDEIRRACGDLPDPFETFVPPQRYANRIELAAPVDSSEALLFGARRLVAELVGFLRARGAGVTRLRLELVHEEVAPTALILGLVATRDGEHILRVLGERLARVALPDCVEAIALQSLETVPLYPTDGDFFLPAGKAGETRVQMIERLRARLGDSAVRTLQLYPDHRPEYAWRYADSVEDGAGAVPISSRAVSRPSWLLPQPQPLPGDPASLALSLVAGPERIEAGWWDGGDMARDYFIGRNAQGGQWWVFKDRQGRWFLHGLFA